MDNEPKSPKEDAGTHLTGIAGAIGGSACGLAALFLIFGSASAAWPAALAIGALAVMGILFAHFLTRKN
ncbi:MAG: hypothetical protein NTY01_12765 [Verrucomicrobia bacterium]|nr:hypothetical protein [Verrucomicrobiota bacterium]